MPRSQRTITLNRYGWLSGLGSISGGATTVEQLGAHLAKTEQALRDLRGSIVLNQRALKTAGKLEAVTAEFNKLRSQYAQQLTFFVAKTKAELEAADRIGSDTPLIGRFLGSSKAQAFDAELVKMTGSSDPGLMLLKTLPVLRPDAGGQLSGALGAPIVGLPAALMISGVALAVAGAVRLSGITAIWDSSAAIKAQTDREAQFLAAVARCNGNVECLRAVGGVDSKKPPPGGSSTTLLVALGVGAAAALLWSAISGRAGAGIARLNTQYG